MSEELGQPPRYSRSVVTEGPAVRAMLVAGAIGSVAALLLMPLAIVFGSAFAKGLKGFGSVFADPDTLSAIGLSLLVTAIVLPVNALNGLATAWAVSRFDF